jgi:L-alanine-DL-glutamate epimerase-like enolase superfamily enzyme
VRLALGTGAVVLVVLLWELARPHLRRELVRVRALLARRRAQAQQLSYDPGRELRAEQRARTLLRSCVDAADWDMYSQLGFLRVPGRLGEAGPDGEPAYAYLIYPHKPVVAYVPSTRELLNEYCVTFPDQTRPFGSARLPDSDDVLAKWMALTADERRLVGEANMHLPGRQVDPDRVRSDLERLARWEASRAPHIADRARAA